jgi:hypothetical protein
MNLQELMTAIRNKPEVFLQNDCIFQLRAFIRGFIFAQNTAAKAICDDHKLLAAIDLKIKKQYGINPTEKVSIEEILNDSEGENACNKYIDLWHKYTQH